MRGLKNIKIKSIFFISLLLPTSSFATISVSSLTSTSSWSFGGVTRYIYPLKTTTGTACTISPAYTYPANLTVLDPTNTSTYLYFDLATTTDYGSTQRYVHAEVLNSTSNSYSTVLLNSGNTYDSYTGDPNHGTTRIGINLSDLCSNSGISQCQSTIANSVETELDITVTVGVTEGQTPFVQTAGSQNNTTAQDYLSIRLTFTRCPSYNTSALATISGNQFYTYTLAVSPGDGSAKVAVLTEPLSVSGQTPYKSKIFLFEKSSTTRTTSVAPMTPASASVISEIPGTGQGYFTIGNLENDSTYNVQMAYVNHAGFITPAGPPQGATSAPQVTPSTIAGLLNKNTGPCFIATAAYGDESAPDVLLLRNFRDMILFKYELGREFVHWYYRWSPAAASWLLNHPQYRMFVRFALFPAIELATVLLWARDHLWILIVFMLMATFLTVLYLNSSRRRRRDFISILLISGLSWACLSQKVVLAATASESTESDKIQPYIEKLKAKDKSTVLSEPGLVQPYIDSLKHDHPAQEESTQSNQGQPYIDSLNSKSNEKNGSSGGHPTDGQPHIEALKEGLQLKPEMKGTVRNAATVTIVATGDFDIQGRNAQANSYQSVYAPQKKYNPGIDVAIERHIFRNRFAGAFGPFFRTGAYFQKGYGRFTRYNSESDVNFRFLAIPMGVGLGYRAIQPRFVVPFVQVGVSGIFFNESRDDDKPSKRGYSTAANLNYGINLSLDWIGRRDAWARYDEYGIFHTYLTIQQMHIKTIRGDVDFRFHMTLAGLSFEF